MNGIFVLLLSIVASVLPAPAKGPSPGAVAPAASSVQAAADEISLANLGIATQTVSGPRASVVALFPAAGRPLASAGSFVRVTFEHSPGAGAGATLDVAVNQHTLPSVPLTEDTAGGSVLEVPTPGADLFSDRPNVFEARFSFPAHRGQAAFSGRTPAQVPFGRIDAETVVHYQLRDPAGSLAAYPFSLLDGSSSAPARLGLVVPTAPTGRELAAAFRLAADVGGRLWTRVLVPDVVASGQEEWVSAATEPALIVGRVDRQALIPSLLERAGFARRGGSWIAPGGGGQGIGTGDGMLAELAPSANRRAPVIVVTGSSDAAVERAAGALIGDPNGLPAAGDAIVRGSPGPARPGPRPSATPPVTVRQPLRGDGEDRQTIALPVETERAAPATLRLATSGVAIGQCAQASAAIDVDGRRAASATLANAPGGLAVPLPAALLRSGPNVVLVRVASSCSHSSSGPSPTLDLTEIPPLGSSAAGGPDLASLPAPFVGAAAGPLTIMLPRADPSSLAAAAEALVRLAEHAADAAPPPLAVLAGTGGPTPAAGSNVLVIGHPASPGGSSLTVQPLQVRLGDLEAIGVPAASGACPGGSIREVALPGQDQRVLWIDGDGAALVAAASMLGDGALRGSSALAGSGGAPCGRPSPPGALTVRLQPQLLACLGLVVAAVLLVAGIVGWELRLSWRNAR